MTYVNAMGYRMMMLAPFAARPRRWWRICQAPEVWFRVLEPAGLSACGNCWMAWGKTVCALGGCRNDTC